MDTNMNQASGNQSGYDGGVLETFLNALIASLIVSFTCGIATPWAICFV